MHNDVITEYLYDFFYSHLLKLVLDCYPYATNELMTSVALHPFLTHVSLASCSLITDAGLRSLKGSTKVSFSN